MRVADIDRVFIACGGRTYSWREIGGMALGFRENLHKQGVRPGDIIAFKEKPSPRSISVLFAAWSLGATTWMCPLRESEAKLKEMQAFIGASFVMPAKAVFVMPAKAGRSVAFFNELVHPQAKTLLNTSGSTGTPKFVEHSLEQHFLSADAVCESLAFDASGSWLLSLPLYHVGGLAILIRSLFAGAKLIIPKADERVADTLITQSVSHVSLVSSQLRQLLLDQRGIDRLTFCDRVVLGGGPIPDWLSEVATLHRLPIVASYGATEMASMVTVTRLGDLASQGSGSALPSRELRINDDGEICVAGPMVSKRDDDGFYQTGDLGRLDKSGNLHIFGRKDNLFISGGENIQPEEIERALLELELVSEAIVVNVPHRHWGERPAAFVRLCSNERIREDVLSKHLRKSLATFKIPDYFFDWPAAKVGELKPSRHRLRQLALELIGS